MVGVGCKKKGDKGDASTGDGSSEQGADDGGATTDGPDGGPDVVDARPDIGSPCNGSCTGNCRGICVGVCSQHTDAGTCMGLCNGVCVGPCEGVCPKPMRPEAPDAVADRASDSLTPDAANDGAGVDGGPDSAPVDVGPDAPGPYGVWIDRTRTTTVSWPAWTQTGAAAYDTQRERVVMFGGRTERGNDIWEWDSGLGTWLQRHQRGGSRPSPRTDHAVAYDTIRRRLIVHGGIDESGLSLSDTWEWDGVNEIWTEKGPGPQPSRFGHAMAFDASVGKVLLFGGAHRELALGDAELFDTWDYDLSADRWTNRTYPLPGSWPRPRRNHGLAYNTTRQVVVMYGGHLPNSAIPAADLWEWHATERWIDRTPATLPAAWPGPRASFGMVDVGAGKVVLFGGGDAPLFWEWNGAIAVWENLTPSPMPASFPAARDHSPMTWDTRRKMLVLSGAWHAVGNVLIADIWEWKR